MAINTAFCPSYGKGVTVSPSGTSASSALGKTNMSVCLTNTGSNICYVRVGQSGVAATTADYPVLAGSQVVIGKQENDDYVAYISSAGTTLHIISGEGI